MGYYDHNTKKFPEVIEAIIITAISWPQPLHPCLHCRGGGEGGDIANSGEEVSGWLRNCKFGEGRGGVHCTLYCRGLQDGRGGVAQYSSLGKPPD